MYTNIQRYRKKKKGKTLLQKYKALGQVNRTQALWNNRKIPQEAKTLQKHADNMNMKPIWDYAKKSELQQTQAMSNIKCKWNKDQQPTRNNVPMGRIHKAKLLCGRKRERARNTIYPRKNMESKHNKNNEQLGTTNTAWSKNNQTKFQANKNHGNT